MKKGTNSLLIYYKDESEFELYKSMVIRELDRGDLSFYNFKILNSMNWRKRDINENIRRHLTQPIKLIMLYNKIFDQHENYYKLKKVYDLGIRYQMCFLKQVLFHTKKYVNYFLLF